MFKYIRQFNILPSAADLTQLNPKVTLKLVIVQLLATDYFILLRRCLCKQITFFNPLYRYFNTLIGLNKINKIKRIPSHGMCSLILN